jgi:hypothetical protein
VARKAPPGAAWAPTPYDLATASAIKALGCGTAEAHQQMLALKWIVEVACGAYDTSFRPGGVDGQRETDFAEGRRFVGTTIVKLMHLNTQTLKDKANG